MDIIKKIKPLKISYQNLLWKHKFGITIIIVALLMSHSPHQAVADYSPRTVLPFIRGDQDAFLKEKLEKAKTNFRYQEQEERLQKQLNRQRILATRLERYLEERNSPLADHAETIVKLEHWKKIVSLANAESSLCKNYPKTTANCWGVGGSSLWDFGRDLDDGVVAMNRFLENYPKKSKLKYSQMTFEQMNGLYKQPAKNHWVYNNKVVYEDLEKLEHGL